MDLRILVIVGRHGIVTLLQHVLDALPRHGFGIFLPLQTGPRDRTGIGRAHHGDEVEARHAILCRQLPPLRHERIGILEVERIEDGEQRLAVHADVARIAECRKQRAEMHLVVGRPQVALLHQDLRTFLARLGIGPGSGSPGVVGPAQTERKVRLPAGNHFIEGTLQQLAAVSEPVVVVAEAFDARFARQRGLRFARFWKTQVVKAQVSRDARLHMPAEQGLGRHYIGPFREPGAPPRIVFRNRVELREIKSDDPILIHLSNNAFQNLPTIHDSHLCL